VIEVRSDKIAELFFARTPTKKKRLGKQNPSIIFFTQISICGSISSFAKITYKSLKTTDFGWASLALLVWI